MQSKRGLSGVITTLIIILLVIAAIGIIWAVVNPFIRESAEEISLAKFTLALQIKNVQYVEDNIEVSVKRGQGDGDLVGLQFIVSDGLNSFIVEKSSTLAQQEMTTYELIAGTDFTWGDADFFQADVTEVSVAPIYATTSGTAVTGDIADTYVIGSGSVGDSGGTTPTTPNPDCDATWTCESLGYTECGTPNDDCGNPLICGSCLGNDVCNGTGQCVTPIECTDTCISLSYECNYNGANWTICGASTDCGSCLVGVCNSTGQCVIILANMTGGIVDEVWPPGVGTYFASEEFPRSEIEYTLGHYVLMTSGTDYRQCYQIYDFLFPTAPEIYNKTHVRLATAYSSISTGDTFDVWGNFDLCNDASSSLP
ncbi:MAG: hypothetical protein KJ566_02300 [Nanoarchaeota archaeon]|nr:hypothetical protein [Nanoarchaeota archaeon]